VRSFGTHITASPQPRPHSLLVDRGAYRLVRHPMYGAVFLSTLGVALAVRAWPGVIVALLVGAFLRVKSAREERILAIVVDGYERYRESVTHRFVPGIW